MLANSTDACQVANAEAKKNIGDASAQAKVMSKTKRGGQEDLQHASVAKLHSLLTSAELEKVSPANGDFKAKPAAEDQHSFDAPFVVKMCPLVLQLYKADHVALKTCLQQFEVEFTGSPQYSASKRGQLPIKTGDVAGSIDNRFSKELLEIAQSFSKESFSDVPESSEIAPLFNTMVRWGFEKTMLYIGAESNDLGTLRIAYKGRRFIMLASLQQILPSVLRDNTEVNNDTVTRTHVMAWMDGLTAGSAKELLLEENSPWRACILNIGDLLYIPAGHFYIEMAMGLEDVFGLRLPVFAASASLQNNFELAMKLETNAKKSVTVRALISEMMQQVPPLPPATAAPLQAEAPNDVPVRGIDVADL